MSLLDARGILALVFLSKSCTKHRARAEAFATCSESAGRPRFRAVWPLTTTSTQTMRQAHIAVYAYYFKTHLNTLSAASRKLSANSINIFFLIGHFTDPSQALSVTSADIFHQPAILVNPAVLQTQPRAERVYYSPERLLLGLISASIFIPGSISSINPWCVTFLISRPGYALRVISTALSKEVAATPT
jgi:hypothetical protein